MKTETENESQSLPNRIIRLSIWLVLSWLRLWISILTGITRFILDVLRKIVLGKKGNANDRS